jgi:hypothetical protein
MHGFTGLDAQEYVMGANILFVKVVAIIAGNQRNGQPLAHIQQGSIYLFLDIDAVILNLKKKIALTEKIKVSQGRVICFLKPVVPDQGWNFAMQTGREGYKTFMVLC